MKKSKRTYPAEFKLEAIQLWQNSDKSAAEIEAELGITPGLLFRWKRKLVQNGTVAFPGKGNLTPEEEKIRQLERENAILRQERDILKKAMAIFSNPNQ